MGTRSGDVDPGLHAHLHRQLGWSLDQIDTVLNKESGLLGLSGLTNDMREIETQALSGHAGAKLALEVFCYRIAKSLAALSCALPNSMGLFLPAGSARTHPRYATAFSTCCRISALHWMGRLTKPPPAAKRAS